MEPYIGGVFFAGIPMDPGVEAVAIVLFEGIPIVSALPQGVDETRIAATNATLLTLSERAIIEEMKKGNFDWTCIKGSEGNLLIMQAGPNAILIVSTRNDARLGLILLDCRRICERIAQLI